MIENPEKAAKFLRELDAANIADRLDAIEARLDSLDKASKPAADAEGKK